MGWSFGSRLSRYGQERLTFGRTIHPCEIHSWNRLHFIRGLGSRLGSGRRYTGSGAPGKSIRHPGNLGINYLVRAAWSRVGIEALVGLGRGQPADTIHMIGGAAWIAVAATVPLGLDMFATAAFRRSGS